MEIIGNYLKILIPYRNIFLIAAFVSLFLIMIVMINATVRKTRTMIRDREKIDKEHLKNLNVQKVPKSYYSRIIRTAIAADGIDPNPLGYTVIMDGAKEVFVRTFTVSQMPKRVTFADTFARLFDFPGCTSSVFIAPISEEAMSRKLDNAITILASEYSMASGDVNRQRKLNAQVAETSSWAAEIENGENRFYDVGFLFSLFATSVTELNKTSDEFHAKAVERGIQVSSCYGLQAEAYALNGPFNGLVKIYSKQVKQNCVIYTHMDKYSVSTLINYTQSSYSHRSGIPLGRDMMTQDPVIFDLASPGHDSMSIAIVGKSGSGKSTLIKCMAARQILFGWHYVAIDSQVRKGCSEGEYAAIAIAAGGVNFQIMNGTEEYLNLFDISETVRAEKTGKDTLKEIKTVDLSGKIATLTNNLCSMILNTSDSKFDSISDQTFIRRIITDTAVQTYNDFGIYEGDVDSLYEEGTGFSGSRLKRMPQISDFYIRILLNAKHNTDETLKNAYNLIVYALKDYIKELYYTKKTLVFLTREEYQNLPKTKQGTRYYESDGIKEDVEAIHGVRAYYDGQSTISINRDCPFTNIDISMLPDSEKKLARQIAIAFVTENYIKKNSERMDTSNFLVVILDEVHECYKDDYARNTVDITIREARKRYVGVILSTQTIKEYDYYPETQAILKLVEVKFIFKQDVQDRNHLVEVLGITPTQADYIVSTIGGNEAAQNGEVTGNGKHKGEMCIIDNKNVCFCKVDYLKATEAIVADTNAEVVEKLFKVQKEA